MKSRRIGVFLIATSVGVALSSHFLSEVDTPTIRFELGKNITQVAKASGAPRFQTRDIDGLVSYGLVNLNNKVKVRYTRAGYELEVSNVFAFTMYADKAISPDLLVDTVDIQFNNSIKSHEQARLFVRSIINQFRQGKWIRYISDHCPAVSGRSAFLDTNGNIDTDVRCSLDPDYVLSEDEWLKLTRTSKYYRWLGDGLWVELKVNWTNDIRGITYSIDLSFEDFAGKTQREHENQVHELAEGDSKGWNSTAKEKNRTEQRRREIELLEKNAVARGDKILPRPRQP